MCQRSCHLSVRMGLKYFKTLNFAGNRKCYSTISYEIPKRYRDSFYLANAAFFDQVNWYLHRAYELCFSKLVSDLKDKEPKMNDTEATNKIITAIEIMDQCNSIIDIRFPINLENGEKEVIRGFRSQYGLVSGFNPTLGGLRMAKDITRDHMKALSALSTYKHACMGIRLAGAHGGIKIDPSKYTEIELGRIVKRYAAELYSKGFCDGQSDILEPDINVGSREMAWIASIFPQTCEKVMVVGKPVGLGGIENYSKMASQGIFFALDHFINKDRVLEQIEMSKGGVEQKTFIIQGLGKLGIDLAKYLANSGAICVGVKECDGYLHDPQGINIQALIEHKNHHGSILKFHNSKPIINDDIFKEQCDILILAAQQKSLICYVADKVKAKIVVEAANGAVTPTAHRILTGRSKLVLPDIYVSTGHAVASYLEYLYSLKKMGREQLSIIRPLYKHVLNAFNVEESRQVVSASTVQKIETCAMESDVLTYAIDHVMKETGNELLDTAKDFNLKLDIRMAGYIKAIHSIHNSIYKLKRY